MLPADLTGWAIVFDLDDTLFLEADYVGSARREIARRVTARYPDVGMTADEMVAVMDAHPAHGPGAFDALHAALPQAVRDEATVLWMRRVYRSHTPRISLATEAEAVLSVLASRGAVLGLITDGRVETQSLKAHALGIGRFIRPELVSVSEAVGKEKYSPLPFERMEALTPGCSHRIYVGDNPAKDFIQPNAMGWDTVRLEHPADSSAIFGSGQPGYPPSHHARHTIHALPELLTLDI